jgi:alpha-glucoside transport system substrate-binding protein
MTARPLNRRRRAAAGIVGLALAATACGTGGSSSDNNAGGDANASLPPGCEDYEEYAGSSGTQVSMYTSIRDIEADRYVQSFEEFEKCTGITINYEGSGEFEAQLNVKVQGGNAPDLAFIPQPGLLQRFVQAGKVKEVPEGTAANVDEFWSEAWKEYGSVDGTLYAAPMGANVKSYVWYSPSQFESAGYEVPTTLDELMTLTEEIAASGKKPWCAGIESGDATGWPATDWVEDMMLRTAGAETYDEWVNHDIPFNDPAVVEAVDAVGAILKNEKYVNAGFGDVRSIATTSFQDAGTPILEGECFLHRQASFYANQWPEGTNVAEDGDVFAFYLPSESEDSKPVLGGGEFVAAFADRPEVQAVQTYLSSDEYANTKAEIGDWISANTGLDVANVANPIDKLSVETLQDESAEFRFDGSDLMPAAVGAGSFWNGMTEWINGADTKSVLDGIEESWPSS